MATPISVATGSTNVYYGGGQLPGKPTLTVSPIGISGGGSPIFNAGADYGPDTPGTSTSGIQEAMNAIASSGGRIQLLSGGFAINSLLTWNSAADISIIGTRGGDAIGSGGIDPGATAICVGPSLPAGSSTSFFFTFSSPTSSRGTFELAHLILLGTTPGYSGTTPGNYGGVTTNNMRDNCSIHDVRFILFRYQLIQDTDSNSGNVPSSGWSANLQLVNCGVASDGVAAFSICGTWRFQQLQLFLCYYDYVFDTSTSTVNEGNLLISQIDGEFARGVAIFRFTGQGGMFLVNNLWVHDSIPPTVFLVNSTGHAIAHLGNGRMTTSATQSFYLVKLDSGIGTSCLMVIDIHDLLFDDTASGSQSVYFLYTNSKTPIAGSRLVYHDLQFNFSSGTYTVITSDVVPPTNIAFHLVNVRGYNPQGFVITTPATPGSGNPYKSTFPFPIRIYILTVTGAASYTIEGPLLTTGSSIPLVAGAEITLDVGATITPTYTTLTWEFYGT